MKNNYINSESKIERTYLEFVGIIDEIKTVSL